VTARACPKCGAALAAGAEACPSCGLAGAHFERFEDQAVAQGGDLPAELVAPWDRCLARWDDEAVHEAFLAGAAAAGAFVAAGRAYRRERRARGAEDVRAAAGLERVARMAQAALLTRPPGPGPGPGAPGGSPPYRAVAGLGIVLVLLALLGGITVHLVKNSPTPTTEPPAPFRPGRQAPAPPSY
jgi:hypothetical protein